jgi:hypothetical protein
MAAASARAALAQQRVPVVGFVGFATPEVDNATLVPFRKAMAELGYVEGRKHCHRSPLDWRRRFARPCLDRRAGDEARGRTAFIQVRRRRAPS